MFVDGGKVVVYSQVNGASLYTAAGITPKDAATTTTVRVRRRRRRRPRERRRSLERAVPYPGRTARPRRTSRSRRSPVLTLDSGDAAGHARDVLRGQLPRLSPRRHARPHGALGQRARPEAEVLRSTSSTRSNVPVLSERPDGAPGPRRRHELERQQRDDHDADDRSVPEDGHRDDRRARAAPRRATRPPSTRASSPTGCRTRSRRTRGAVAVSSIACEDFYVPTTGSTESGLTEVASIDLANPDGARRVRRRSSAAPRPSTAARTPSISRRRPGSSRPTPGQDDTSGSGSSGSGTVNGGTTRGVASSPRHRRQRRYARRSVRATRRPRRRTSVIAWATSKTHIHKFEFTTDAGFPNYVASGTVVGNVKDQFSLDDTDGYLRIATSESRMYVDQNGKYVSADVPRSDDGPAGPPADRQPRLRAGRERRLARPRRRRR